MNPIYKVKKNKRQVLSIVTVFSLVISFCIPLLMLQSVTHAAHTDYNYFKKITINHNLVDNNLKNFPVYIKIVDDSDIYGDVLSNLSDIAFFDSSNSTQFNHELISYSLAGNVVNAEIMVNITSVSSSVNTVFYMYYGDSDGVYSKDGYNPEDVWDSDFLGVWHCNDDHNNLANDSTSNDNDLTLVNTPTVTASGISGSCLTFEASNSEYAYHATLLDSFPATCTYEVWVKEDTFTSNHRIIRKVNINSADQFNINANDGSPDTYKISIEGSEQGAIETVSSLGIPEGSWEYISAVYNGNGNKAEMVHNKTVDLTINTVNTIRDGTYDDFKVAGDSSFLDGKIDELRVSQTNRNDSWRNATYENFADYSNFITIGSENQGDGYIVDSSGTVYGLTSDKFTWQEELGNTSWANNSGSHYETMEFNFSYNGIQDFDYIRLNISDIDTNITASNISIQFSSTNLTWGTNGTTLSDGSNTVIVNNSNWVEANGYYDSNPFPISSNTSVFMRMKLIIPSGIGNETYSISSWTWDLGYY